MTDPTCDEPAFQIIGEPTERHLWEAWGALVACGVQSETDPYTIVREVLEAMREVDRPVQRRPK